MFTAQLIGAAFVAMFAAVGLLELGAKLRRGWIQKAGAWGGLGAAVYCIGAGLFLLGDWQNPLAAADPQQIGQVAGRGRGRAGIIILAISSWPYVLLGLGGYFAWGYFVILRRLFPRGHA